MILNPEMWKHVNRLRIHVCVTLSPPRMRVCVCVCVFTWEFGLPISAPKYDRQKYGPLNGYISGLGFQFPCREARKGCVP